MWPGPGPLPTAQNREGSEVEEPPWESAFTGLLAGLTGVGLGALPVANLETLEVVFRLEHCRADRGT